MRLICIDRDGTLIHDTTEHLFIGSTPDWEKQVRILPGVVEGLREMNKLLDTRIYMITNQSGVAVKEMPLLTEARSNEVCQYVFDELAQQGVKLNGFFACPHVDPLYVERHPEYTVDAGLVCECDCIKPRLGMVFAALEQEGIKHDAVEVWVIGDRASDVETGINAGGTGILVPYCEAGEKKKTARLSGKHFVAKDLREAARLLRDAG